MMIDKNATVVTSNKDAVLFYSSNFWPLPDISISSFYELLLYTIYRFIYILCKQGVTTQNVNKIVYILSCKISEVI